MRLKVQKKKKGWETIKILYNNEFVVKKKKITLCKLK